MTVRLNPLSSVKSFSDLLLAEVVHAPGHLPGEAQDILLGDLVLSHQSLVQVHITLDTYNESQGACQFKRYKLSDDEAICARLLCMKLLREPYWANSMISKMGPGNKHFNRFIKVSVFY